MNPYKVRELLRQRPFRPFRVHLTDGKSYDIRYPENNLVLKSTFKIGIPKEGFPFPVAEYVVTVPWEDIARLEFLDTHAIVSSSS